MSITVHVVHMNRMNEIRSTYENSLPNKAGGRGRRDWCTTERIKKGERNYCILCPGSNFIQTKSGPDYILISTNMEHE